MARHCAEGGVVAGDIGVPARQLEGGELLRVLLTAKIEGLWVSLEGDNRGGAVAVPVPGNLNPATFLPSASTNDNEFFVARVGVNYKFSSY